MKKHIFKMIIPLFALLLTGCSLIPQLLELEQPAATPTEVMENTPEAPNIPQVPALTPNPQLIRTLTSSSMREFETQNAVSLQQARYLAFGAFVPTLNSDTIRVFALYNTANCRTCRGGGYHACSRRMLANSWSITDHETAMTQLTSLANATGQSPIADDIFNTFVRNGILQPPDPDEMLTSGFDIATLQNLHRNAVTRTERRTDEIEQIIDEWEIPEEEWDDVFELFVLMEMYDRISRGLTAYVAARDMLINMFGFTEEELLNIPTLAAWDYGRTAIIARYGVAAGFLQEDDAWEYLKLAADSASAIYSCWRQYTAAHVLGRAIAFGSNSHDLRYVIDYLLNHSESPFADIEF